MQIQEIKDLFLLHPNKMNKGASKLAERFGVSKDDIYKIKEEVRELLCNDEKAELVDIIIQQEEVISELIREVNNDKGTLKSTTESTFEPKDAIELAELHKIDLTKYKISNYWSKLKSNGKFTSSVLATLRKVENDLPLQKDIVLNEIKEYISSSLLSASFDYFTNSLDQKPKKGNKMLELSIPDVHFGKLSWREETGEDYDLKIATKRYKEAIVNLLRLANLDQVSEIVLPIGNDMFNVENNSNFTTAGTPQDCDSRFHKMVKTVKEILIETITGLSAIANVRVVIVPGNHDMSTMFMMGEILESYFHNIKNVEIDNTPTLRKYVQFGKCGFQYTHGNEEKHGDLGLIFATEQPHLWAATEFRFAKLGHFHKSKTINYTSVDSYQGFQVQILPSLSGSDFWHSKKGYISQKQAKAFFYDPEKGEIANYTYTV